MHTISFIEIFLCAHRVVWGRGDVHTGFWWGNLKEREHLEDQGVDERIILRWIFRKWDGMAWNGSIRLKIGTDGGHL